VRHELAELALNPGARPDQPASYRTTPTSTSGLARARRTIQPVISIEINKEWSLITRTVLPV